MKIEGAKELKAKLEKMRDVRKQINRIYAEEGKLFSTFVIEKIEKGTRTGRAYSRGGETHIASALGEYPKSDSGTLAGDITYKRTPGGFKVGVQKGTVASRYAKYLEFPGGNTSDKSAPLRKTRSFLRRALKSEREKILKNIVKSFDEFVKGV